MSADSSNLCCDSCCSPTFHQDPPSSILGLTHQIWRFHEFTFIKIRRNSGAYSCWTTTKLRKLRKTPNTQWNNSVKSARWFFPDGRSSTWFLALGISFFTHPSRRLSSPSNFSGIVHAGLLPGPLWVDGNPPRCMAPVHTAPVCIMTSQATHLILCILDVDYCVMIYVHVELSIRRKHVHFIILFSMMANKRMAPSQNVGWEDTKNIKKSKACRVCPVKWLHFTHLLIPENS